MTWRSPTYTHQVISASLEQGVREGRVLLHDWLVILTAQYNDACKVVQYDHGSSTGARIDIAFSQCTQLQPLPRLVFALLRNQLLRFHEEGVHPDYRIYLQCLFRYINVHFLAWVPVFWWYRHWILDTVSSVGLWRPLVYTKLHFSHNNS